MITIVLLFLAHIFGLDNAAGFFYLLWSGIVGDLTIFGAAWAIVRKHNCEIKGCPRIGKHDWVDASTGLTHNLCRKHHPHDHLTAQHVHDVHTAVVLADHQAKLDADAGPTEENR